MQRLYLQFEVRNFFSSTVIQLEFRQRGKMVEKLADILSRTDGQTWTLEQVLSSNFNAYGNDWSNATAF